MFSIGWQPIMRSSAEIVAYPGRRIGCAISQRVALAASVLRSALRRQQRASARRVDIVGGAALGASGASA
jgi:hypothetical protein